MNAAVAAPTISVNTSSPSARRRHRPRRRAQRALPAAPSLFGASEQLRPAKRSTTSILRSPRPHSSARLSDCICLRVSPGMLRGACRSRAPVPPTCRRTGARPTAARTRCTQGCRRRRWGAARCRSRARYLRTLARSPARHRMPTRCASRADGGARSRSRVRRTSPVDVIMMLRGLRSAWTMSRRCACASAAPTLLMSASACSRCIGPSRRRMMSASNSPSSSSITMKYVSASRSRSNTLTMFGCDNDCA